MVTGLDQAIGVEDEQATFGQLEFLRFVGQPVEAKRGTSWQVNEVRPALGGDDGRERVAGSGDRAAAGDRVVHRVQARRAEVASGRGPPRTPVFGDVAGG